MLKSKDLGCGKLQLGGQLVECEGVDAGVVLVVGHAVEVDEDASHVGWESLDDVHHVVH